MFFMLVLQMGGCSSEILTHLASAQHSLPKPTATPRGQPGDSNTTAATAFSPLTDALPF